MPEQTHQEEKKDEAFMKRLNECMNEMIKNGFVGYTDKETGKREKLTFHTVISEGIEDAEMLIPTMFRFFQLDRSKSPFDFAARLTFLDQIEQLVTKYIEGSVIASEQGE